MIRLAFRSLVILAVALTFGLGSNIRGAPERQPAPARDTAKRPNILLVLLAIADDWAWPPAVRTEIQR